VYEVDYGGAGDWSLPGGVGGDGSVERKRFFFETRSKKLLLMVGRGWAVAGASTTRSFGGGSV